MEEVVLCISPKEPHLGRLQSLMERVSSYLNSKSALKFPPHITVVHRIHTELYDKLIDKLKDAALSIHPFKLSLKGYYSYKDPKIIFLSPKPEEEITAIHSYLLPVVTACSNGWVRESFFNLKLEKPRQTTYLQRYGSPFVLEFFHPHLTLAGPDVDEKIFAEITSGDGNRSPSFSFYADDLCLMRNANGRWIVDKRIPIGYRR